MLSLYSSTDDCHQFITLSTHLCVPHCGRDAAGASCGVVCSSWVAETYLWAVSPPAEHSGARWMFSTQSFCLFVCLLVIVNTITSIKWWNLKGNTWLPKYMNTMYYFRVFKWPLTGVFIYTAVFFTFFMTVLFGIWAVGHFLHVFVAHSIIRSYILTAGIQRHPSLFE